MPSVSRSRWNASWETASTLGRGIRSLFDSQEEGAALLCLCQSEHTRPQLVQSTGPVPGVGGDTGVAVDGSRDTAVLTPSEQ